MEQFFWIFLALAFFFWVSGWIMSARFRRVPEPEEEPISIRVSIVIPARNEEENLARLLPSLTRQDLSAHEIIVVDDQSEDRTAELAREHGAIVVEGEALPEGWYGKPWACQQGASRATGDWLLFLDADTELEGGGLRRIAALAEEENAVHSICPYHRVEEGYEQLSSFFNVIMLLGMNAFTIRGKAAQGIGLFGQAMFVSRQQYEKVGGHEPVKREVLENFHLSRHFKQAGFHCRCYLGAGTLSMRMFPDGLAGLVAGWSKGFVSGADNTPRAAVVGISFWLSGLIMSVISLTFLPLASTAVSGAIGVFYLLCAGQCFYLFRNAGSFWGVGALLFPVGLIFYQVLFFRAVRKRRQGEQTQWKGRDVG